MASTLEKVSGNNYIPDDIVFSVLSKLSIKSLKRFSCVGKSWSHLFENSYFLNMFRNNVLLKSHSPYDDDDDDDDACYIFNWFRDPVAPLSFLTGDKFEKEIKYPRPPLCNDQDDKYTCILSSVVYGILCIYEWYNETKVVMWNPATNEVYIVPPNLPNYLPYSRATTFLHGFGYDRVSNDYKVIRFVYMGQACDCFWEIYSLKSNSWRQLKVDMKFSYIRMSGSDVYVNGVCHWILLRKEYEKIYLVSFNLSNEVFFKTLFDLHVDVCFKLVVLNGSVAMISNHKQTTSFSISILGEIGVKESWIKLFEIGPLAFVDSPIAAAAGKKGNIFFKIKDGKLGCFDLTTGVFEEIAIANDGNNDIWHIVIYKKTLHPIKERNK